MFVLMQVSRGFASQAAKPTGKEIKVLDLSVMSECSCKMGNDTVLLYVWEW